MSRTYCRGLNIFEFVAILLIVGGLSYGFTRGLDAGPWEATVGALKWGGIAWVVFAAWMLCVLVPLWLFLLYRPYPRCSSGRCKDRDYRLLSEDEMAELRAALRDSQALQVRCRCGRCIAASSTSSVSTRSSRRASCDRTCATGHTAAGSTIPVEMPGQRSTLEFAGCAEFLPRLEHLLGFSPLARDWTYHLGERDERAFPS